MATAPTSTGPSVIEAQLEILAVRAGLGLEANPKTGAKAQQEEIKKALGTNPNYDAMAAKLKAYAEKLPESDPKKAALSAFTPAKIAEAVRDLNEDYARLIAEANKGKPAAAGAAPAKPAVDKSADVKVVEEALTKIGIKVGARDGVADADFHKATTSLKTLIASVSGVQVDPGQCTPKDCDALLKGIQGFLGSQQFKDLQQIRKGTVPESITKDLGMVEAAGLRAAIALKGTEAERVQEFLTLAADSYSKSNDPAKKAIAEGIKKIPPHMLANMPAVLDMLSHDGAKLAQSLKVVYTPDAPGAAPAAQKPAAATTQAPAAPPAAPAPAAPAPAAPLTAEQELAKTNASIELVESVLQQKIMPQLGKFSGFLGKFVDVNKIVPTITADQIGNKDAAGNQIFDAQSQRMTATLVMALKELGGEQGANGVYNEVIGKDLQTKILTEDAYKVVRDGMGLRKFTQDEAKVLLSNDADLTAEGIEKKKKLEAEARELRLLFQSLDDLAKKNKLLAQPEAETITKGNLMIDAAAGFLDKFPKIKAMIVGFLKTDLGQMVAGAAAMMGYDLNRLVDNKQPAKSPEQLADQARPVVEKAFRSNVDEAKAALAAAGNKSPDVPTLMGKTEEILMGKMGSPAMTAISAVVFKDAKDDTIKAAIQQAMAEAKKAPNEEAAIQNFTNKLAELGQQYRKTNNITIDPQVAREALNKIEVQLGGQPVSGVVIPPKSEFQAPVLGGGTGMAAGAPVTTAGAAQSVAAPEMPKGGMQFKVGEHVITLAPKTVEAATDTFKQGPIRLSKGRIDDISAVIVSDFDKLGLTGIKPDQLMKAGKPVDAATPAFVRGMTEILVRAQVENADKEGKVLKPEDFHLKFDAKGQSLAVNYMRQHGVDAAKADQVMNALHSMANDHTTAKGKTVSSSVLEQSFYSPLFKVVGVTDVKPAPAAPAVDPNAIKVDPKDQAVFDLFKKNGKDPNCEPLVFWGKKGADGVIVPSEKGQDGAEPMLGYVDRKDGNKFKLAHINQDGNDYVKTRKLPEDIYNKVADNYVLAVKIDGKTVNLGMEPHKPTPEQVPFLKAEIQRHIDCRLDLPSLLAEQKFKPAAAPPAVAPVAPAPEVRAEPPKENLSPYNDPRMRAALEEEMRRVQAERDRSRGVKPQNGNGACQVTIVQQETYRNTPLIGPLAMVRHIFGEKAEDRVVDATTSNDGRLKHDARVRSHLITNCGDMGVQGGSVGGASYGAPANYIYQSTKYGTNAVQINMGGRP